MLPVVKKYELFGDGHRLLQMVIKFEENFRRIQDGLQKLFLLLRTGGQGHLNDINKDWIKSITRLKISGKTIRMCALPNSMLRSFLIININTFTIQTLNLVIFRHHDVLRRSSSSSKVEMRKPLTIANGYFSLTDEQSEKQTDLFSLQAIVRSKQCGIFRCLSSNFSKYI